MEKKGERMVKGRKIRAVKGAKPKRQIFRVISISSFKKTRVGKALSKDPGIKLVEYRKRK